MNLLYDFRGLRYDTLVAAGLPPGVGCGPMAVGVGRLQGQGLCCAPVTTDGLGGLKGGGLLRQTTIGEQPTPSLLTTNFNARIQYLFQSRFDKTQKVKRSVRCEACDITLNSELQAKQHYKGKFHQRKLRQQTQQPIETSDTSSETKQSSEISGGLKRSSDQLSDGSSDHAVKLIRLDNESETRTENESETRTENESETRTENESETSLENESESTSVESNQQTSGLVTVASCETASSAAKTGDRDDAVRTRASGINDAYRKITEACRITSEAERRSRELEISIRVKNLQRNNIPATLIQRPISIPVTGLTQFHPLPAPVLPREMLLTPQSLVTCHSIPIQPSLIPWNGAWVHAGLAQPSVQTHRLSFNGAIYGSSQNSARCLTSGFVSNRLPSSTAPEVNVTSGLALPFAVLQQATPTQTSALSGSLGVRTDKNFGCGRGHGLTAIGLSNQATSSWRPDPTQLLSQPVGVVCSKDLDRLDPVSRAVYGNFLGHFTTKRTRCRSGRLR